MNHFLGVLLLLGAASALPTAQVCVSQKTYVTSSWSAPLLIFSADQSCDLSFVVPAGYYAVVDVQAKNVDYYDGIYINDQLGQQVSKFSKSNTFSSNQAWPGSVDVSFRTQQNKALQVSITVTAKKLAPQANVVSKVTTGVNSPSTVIYFQDLVEGSSYSFTSASKLDVKSAYVSNSDHNQLGNIFVYDGGVLIGSLLKNNFIFSSNQVTLYVAKKPTNMRGAILATDKSNIDKYEAHYVSYAPVDAEFKRTAHLIKGDDNTEGAFTIIGDKDGSTPIDVEALKNLDDLNGKFTVLSGGPVANNAQASPVTLTRIPGNVSTFYLSRGRGTIQYSTPGN